MIENFDELWREIEADPAKGLFELRIELLRGEGLTWAEAYAAARRVTFQLEQMSA